MAHWILVAMLWIDPVVIYAADPEPIAWREAKPLLPESVGPSLGRNWIRQFNAVPLPNGAGHMQLFTRKATERGLLTLLSLNLQTGTMKEHVPIQAYEIWSQMQVGPLLYIGINLPDLLLRYNPVRDEVEQLGDAFVTAQGIYSMNLDPNGIVLMGSIPPGEASEYDPVTRQFVKYGQVLASNGGYTYSLNGDATSIIAAIHGDTWDVVSINRATKSVTTLLTIPTEGFVQIGSRNSDGNVTVRVSRPGAAQPEVYKVVNGQLVLNDRSIPSTPSVPSPTVVLDVDSSYFLGHAPVYYRRVGESTWNQTAFDTTIEPRPIHLLEQTADGSIVGAPKSYGSLLSWNSKTKEGRVLGVYMASINGLATWNGNIYAGSYPSAALTRINPGQLFTHEYEILGQPGIPSDTPAANPWRIKYLGPDLEGAHDVGHIVPAADGALYIGGLRFRYHDGFRLGRFNPVTHVHEKIEDGALFDHFAFSWMAPLQQGEKIAITTWVDYDSIIGGPEPESAKIFVYDTKQRKFTEHIPLPGIKRLIHIVEISDGIIVGTGIEGEVLNHAVGTEITTVFRYDLRTRTLLQTKRYTGIVGALSGGTNLFPRAGHGFELGPDGWIWTAWQMPYVASPSLVLRINPLTLELVSLGHLTGEIRFLFDKENPGDVYFTGAPQLRRIRGLVSVPITVKPPAKDGSEEGFENFPNVFNLKNQKNIRIQLNLKDGRQVTLKILTKNGDEVISISNGGASYIDWDGTNGSKKVAAGVYILALDIGNGVKTRKVVVVK